MIQGLKNTDSVISFLPRLNTSATFTTLASFPWIKHSYFYVVGSVVLDLSKNSSNTKIPVYDFIMVATTLRDGGEIIFSG
jgi:hypothetical protein